MGILKFTENRVKCGRCNSEFDMHKNDGCPLCRFGSKSSMPIPLQEQIMQQSDKKNYLAITHGLKIAKKNGNLTNPQGNKEMWGMVNSTFSGKAVARILANMMLGKNTAWISLDKLMEKTSEVVKESGLEKFRGFPKDLNSESSVRRLVYHFVGAFIDMGLFEVRVRGEQTKNWTNEAWKNVEITLTYEGLEFAKLRNRIFDDSEDEQVLTSEEKEWFLNHLKRIDKEGYTEYRMLKDVYEFIKAGHNGKDDLRNWFTKNKLFLDYVKRWSRKSDDDEAFDNQIQNLAITFAAGKIALLRELGIIQNKRNDYKVIGGL